jgi:DNA replication protein DnaC
MSETTGGQALDRIQKWVEDSQRRLESMTPEQRAAEEQKRKESEKESRQIQVNSVRLGWNAPARQTRKEDIDRSGAWGKKESELVKMLGTGFLVALVGGRGPGKTQMGIELMKKATSDLRPSYYQTLTGLFLEIKATFKNDSRETEEDLMDRMVKPSLLVIDEVGRKSDGDWENRMFFELVDRRYRAMKDTLLIANHTKDQFLETIGESLASRMQETGGIIECNWESYRL